MNHHDHGQLAGGEPQGRRSTRGKIAFAVFLAVTLFFLLTEHRAHLFGFLPFLLLLACPLMHMFHHGGHGGRDHGAQPPEGGPTPTRKES